MRFFWGVDADAVSWATLADCIRQQETSPLLSPAGEEQQLPYFPPRDSHNLNANE
jgi:hypothetical protein